MTPIELLACQTAMEDMRRKGRFDVCVIRSIIEISGVVPDQKAFETLRLLHMIPFSDMPADLRRSLPDLIRQTLRGIEIDLSLPRLPETVTDATAVNRRFFGLLPGRSA